MPVFNEEKTVEKIIRKIQEINFDLDWELIIVNDGSTDQTETKLKEIIARNPQNNLRLVSYSPNQGKGHAIQVGLKEATGNILAIQDADLEYNPAEIPLLAAPIIRGQTSVVYGSRFKGKILKISFWHYLGNIFLTQLTNLLFGAHLTDMETCYKIFTQEVRNQLNLKENGFEIEAEITAKILKSGFKILELPISYEARPKSAGKKINWADGVKTAFKIIQYRFKK